MFSSELFIDVDHHQICKTNRVVCGDVFLSRRLKEENRTLVVLSDGLGSGIKANVLASLTAGMIVNFMALNESMEHFTEIILNTLPVDSFRKIGFSTFSIIDIESDGETRIIEYGNPSAIILHEGKKVEIKRELVQLPFESNHHQNLYLSKYKAQKNDRIIFMTDGVTQSGMGRNDMPFGWDRSLVEQFIEKQITKTPLISARDLCRKINQQALSNDIQKAKDDITCGSIHFTKARQLLICTGPPFKPENDEVLANKVEQFTGSKILCGGTTAEIISREWDKEIEVDLINITPNLPPISKIEGIDLVTEGILTLGRLSALLEANQFQEEPENSPAGEILKMCLENDEILIIIGTKVNNAHQDPNLPVELEIRRNVMKRIARLLETNLMKRVILEYI